MDRLLPSGRGPTYFTRTVDGGITWEAPRAIYDPGGTSQTINNQTVVLTDGTLVTFFTQFRTVDEVMVIRSIDKGITWSAPFTVADVQSIGTYDPDSARLVRDGATSVRSPPAPAARWWRCGRTRAFPAACATA